MKMAILAVLFLAEANAARFTISVLTGDPNGGHQSVIGELRDDPVSHDLSSHSDYDPFGHDRAFTTINAAQNWFTGVASTSSSAGPDGTEGTIAEALLYWESSPLLVTSSIQGSGFVELEGECFSGGDTTACESSAGEDGSLLMPIEFGAPTRIWFSLYARSEGNFDTITSLATAAFTGTLLSAFDAAGNQIDFSYAFLPESGIAGVHAPEPSTWLLLLSGVVALLLGRRLREQAPPEIHSGQPRSRSQHRARSSDSGAYFPLGR